MTDETTIQNLENAALAHAKARDILAERIRAIEEDQQKILRRRRAGLRSALAEFDTTRQVLMNHVVDNPQLFKRPRTRIMHGLRVGFMKQKGKVIVSNVEKSIAAIKKLFPNKAESLINVNLTLPKTGLAQLTADELKRIGVQVTADTDAPVIKSTDSDIDKLIKAISEEAWIQEGLADG